jgi:hypothetical protein
VQRPNLSGDEGNRRSDCAPHRNNQHSELQWRRLEWLFPKGNHGRAKEESSIQPEKPALQRLWAPQSDHDEGVSGGNRQQWGQAFFSRTHGTSRRGDRESSPEELLSLFI